MKELAIVILAIIITVYIIKFLPYVAEKFLDWFYGHSEPEQTEIEIQIVVSIAALCVLIILFG